MSRIHAHQLIEAADVSTNLLTTVNSATQTECATRPLARLEPKQQVDALSPLARLRPLAQVGAVWMNRSSSSPC
jgi:hypothetical protein